MLIASASQGIEAYCKRHFSQGTHTEIYSGGKTRIELRNYPVQSIQRVTKLTGESISGYELLPEVGTLLLPAGWPAGEDNIKIEYEAGYTTWSQVTGTEQVTLPACIEMACIRYVQMMYEGNIGKVSERLGDYAVTYTDTPNGQLPQPVAQLLEPCLGRWL